MYVIRTTRRTAARPGPAVSRKGGWLVWRCLLQPGRDASGQCPARYCEDPRGLGWTTFTTSHWRDWTTPRSYIKIRYQICRRSSVGQDSPASSLRTMGSSRAAHRGDRRRTGDNTDDIPPDVRIVSRFSPSVDRIGHTGCGTPRCILEDSHFDFFTRSGGRAGLGAARRGVVPYSNIMCIAPLPA